MGEYRDRWGCVGRRRRLAKNSTKTPACSFVPSKVSGSCLTVLGSFFDCNSFRFNSLRCLLASLLSIIPGLGGTCNRRFEMTAPTTIPGDEGFLLLTWIPVDTFNPIAPSDRA